MTRDDNKGQGYNAIEARKVLRAIRATGKKASWVEMTGSARRFAIVTK